MGMNLDNMAAMLRCASNDDIVSMEADNGGDTVKFMFESPYKISDYEMNLMDIGSEALVIPETEYQAIVRMPASEFARICKDLSNIVNKREDPAVIISVTNEGVRFSTEGDNLSANIFCRIKTAADEREEVTIVNMVKPDSLAFSLKHLTSFTKATPLAAQVTISISENIPIVVEYRMGNMGHIRFYLAPRIEEEVVEVEDGSESEPNVETKPEPEIKLKEEIETDETKPQVEAKEAVEVMGAETDQTKPQVEVKEEVDVVDAE